MEPSDEALVLACRGGDPNAWAALVDRYQRLIYAIARRAGLDEDQSADVFQRVFAILVEHLDRVENPALVGAWLATTARHEAWRFSRRERAARMSGGDSPSQASDLVDDGSSLDEILMRLEEQHKVRTAVAALDERCRTLLILLFYRSDPPSYAEIATTLGASEGSIGPTRARCLQKLRHLLDEMGF
jgi:RNA polymerase sigma factor (sigma-70 family)